MSLSPLCPCVTSNLHVSTVIPASITVSHDFTVQGYSSPPFGSNYQCFDSKLNPMDSRSVSVEGSLSQVGKVDTCTGFAFTTHHRSLKSGSPYLGFATLFLNTCTDSRLLDPCSKTGSANSFLINTTDTQWHPFALLRVLHQLRHHGYRSKLFRSLSCSDSVNSFIPLAN